LIAAAWPLAAGAAALIPPKIIQTVEARFPATLERSIINQGDATVLVSIAADGTLADTLVAGYSHVDFAREAVAALREWRYEPAQLDGAPVSVRLALKFEFSTTTRVVTLMPLDTAAALMRQPALHAGQNLVASARELDHPLAVLRAVSPRHPGAMAKEPAGRVRVDFYVDETGHARLPVILESTHPAFAASAIQALGEWQFSVPTRHGRTVIVRIQQEFLFEDGV
jgi:TonB family protein